MGFVAGDKTLLSGCDISQIPDKILSCKAVSSVFGSIIQGSRVKRPIMP